ncbi:hypothetical protein P4H70_26595 [Paenibacillus ehimensis]|uniref:hypothetical protein n=1 Tax=Paenibacillus ehimensis TaxID=79264 RepID=UPI002DB68729|nr:hypothetical protein [Paenibacillus ehimensis]MEC0212505.1 hypothetical protein [Paenibacillus ehimensis]
MPPRKQEPPVRSDAAEKTDVNGKLLEGAEAASAATIPAERQQPGTRSKRSAKTKADAQPTETGDAAAKTRASKRKGDAGVQTADPQPKEAAEAAPLAEEAALTVAAAAEPAPEHALPAATAEVKAAAADTPEENTAPVLQRLGTRLKKKERNETHDKDRVFIRKDLKLRLDALAENRGKGFKTLLLNYGLEKALDELEQAEAARQED